MDPIQAPLAHHTVYDTPGIISCKVVNAHLSARCGGYTTNAMQEALQFIEQGGTSI